MSKTKKSYLTEVFCTDMLNYKSEDQSFDKQGAARMQNVITIQDIDIQSNGMRLFIPAGSAINVDLSDNSATIGDYVIQVFRDEYAVLQ